MKKNKIIIKGKAKIFDNGIDKYIIKEKNKPLNDLFNYLDQRNFNNHPKIIEETDDKIKYEYFDSFNESTEKHLIENASHLHSSTTYFKDVSTKKYKDIYNKLIDNVDYLKNEYNKKISLIDNENYMAPSSYLFARNYTLFFSNLIYIEKSLNKWFKLVSNKTKERVCVVHNNLKRDNVLVSNNNTILTGWDNFVIDTPVLDLYKLYKNEYNNLNFVNIIKDYEEEYSLLPEEKILLSVLISMPYKINEELSEYDKVREVRNLLNYVIKSNTVIKSGVFD